MSAAGEASESPRIGLRCPWTGKAIYPSLEQAQAMLDRPDLRSVDGSGNVPCRAYLCPVCEGYHLTHHTRRKGHS